MPRPRLRFDDPALEAEFLAADDRATLTWFRLGGIAGTALAAAFIGVDVLVAERNLVEAESIRVVILLASAVAIWASFRPWWLRIQRDVAPFVLLPWAWGWAAMSAIADFPLVYMSLASPMLMFWLAVLLRPGLVRTTLGCTLILPGLAAALVVQEADLATWVLNVAFTVNFYSAAILTAYLLERGARRAFLQQRLIRRYAPPSVAEAIETSNAATIDAPQRRRVTVLFSDVVGFTDTADALDPESLAQVVHEYLAAMADIVERHGGTLNEFAGDGVMALFGAPVERPPEDQVTAALAAATEIQATLPELNRHWFRLGLDHELRTRIGINTGVLSVGTFGSDGRATYTGIGLQTNIAARIQARCEPGAILLSQASWHLVKDTIPCEERGEAEVKGVHFPITLYAPLGTVPSQP